MAKKRDAKLIAALKKIQKICANASQSESIQDIWRTANFVLHDAEKSSK